MPRSLRFETVVRDSGAELPMLVDVDSVSANNLPDTVRIDGEICDIDEAILHRLVSVIERITKEPIPQGHFRDCASFTMAMCGAWMPTHVPFSRRHKAVFEHDDTMSDPMALRGPVSTGIPNDGRCLGYGDANFVYGHSGYVVETSWGALALHKLNMNSEYSLSTISGLMSTYQDEVVHPLTRLAVSHMGEETFRWERYPLDSNRADPRTVVPVGGPDR